MSIQAVAWVLDHSPAEWGARLALISIANHADASGRDAWPSYATIAKEARMSRRAAIDAVARLEASQAIRIRKQASPQGTNVYTVLGIGGAGSALGGEDDGEAGDIQVVKPASPEPSFNHLTAVPNPKRPKKPVDNRTWAQKENDRRLGGEGARFLETTPEYIAEVEAKAEPPGVEVPKAVRPAEAARARSLIKSTLRKGS